MACLLPLSLIDFDNKIEVCNFKVKYATGKGMEGPGRLRR